MAKRKRLTPPVIDPAAPSPAPAVTSLPRGLGASRPPIADVAHDAAATSALNEVAQTLTEARTEGRLIQKIPLAQIDETYLVRDRMAADQDEMAALTESLRTRGQQTAIEVTALEDGRFGLISGWRRLMALRQMSQDPKIDTILAIIRYPQNASAAYVAMVEENEIRAGLSFYERARIVVRAVDRGVYRSDKQALSALFSAAPRAKRSKIGSFVRIVRSLDDALTFPSALTEKSGLALVRALDSDESLAARLSSALQANPPATALAEAQMIAVAMRAPARVKPSPEPLTDGLSYVAQANGAIVLQGEALKDPAFAARVLDALRQVK